MSSNIRRQRKRESAVTCEICHLSKQGEGNFKHSWNSRTGYEYRCKQCTYEARLRAAEEDRERWERRRERNAGSTLLFASTPLQPQHRAQAQFIYTLVDPRTNVVHYVGRSSKPQRRFRQHLYATRANNFCTAEKESWIRELRALGLCPVMTIVEAVKSPTRRTMERERRWMFHYIQEGAPLKNWEAIARPYLANAIKATTVDFLNLSLKSKVWLPLYRAAQQDFEEIEKLRSEAEV